MYTSDPNFRVFVGEQENLQACNASLRITGDDLRPAEISELLGLQPTRSFEKGERYQLKSARIVEYAIGAWHLSTEDYPSKSLELHCRRLLDLLRAKLEILRRLRDSGRYRVSVSLWWDSKGEGGSFNILGDTMSELSGMCGDVEFHII